MKKHIYPAIILALSLFSTLCSAATISYWAYGNDDSVNSPKYLNTDIKGHKNKPISINYTLEKNWTNISTHLWLKAVDDTCLHRSPSQACFDGFKGKRDPSEKAVISNIEGVSGHFSSTEINGLGWYDLNLDVTAFLLADIDDTFKAFLKPTFHRDFWFENAKLVIDYDLKPVPVPAAFWLFGSAMLGLVKFNRKSMETLTTKV